MAIHISNVSFNSLKELAAVNTKGVTSGFYSSTRKAPWYGNSPGVIGSDSAINVQYEDYEGDDDFDYGNA